MRLQRKNIRLPSENYQGTRLFFVTLCCEQRRPIFADGDKAHWLIDQIRQETEKHPFAVHAFCVMPDHVHMLTEGLVPTSNLLLFVKALKQKTAFLHGKECRERLWQKKFYDHILRRGDSLDSVAWYIWMNPVRKGMCARPEEYPHSGSFTVEWRGAPPAREAWVPPWKKAVVR